MTAPRNAGPIVAAVVMAAAASIGPLAATASAQVMPVRSCYGDAVSYTSYPGSGSSNSYWPERGIYALTSGSCNDINVKTTATRDVKICFRRTGACNGWTRAAAGQWTVVATSVLPNTDFYVQFKGTSVSRGQLAY